MKANELNLEFTRVAAPLDGQISRHRLAAGNLVEAGAAVADHHRRHLDPIRFVFDAPEAALLKYKREQEAEALGNDVDIQLQDETEISLERAHRVRRQRASTRGPGTIRARALVSPKNPTGGFLTPGMFGITCAASNRSR